MSGVATYIDGKLELAVNNKMQEAYKDFTKNVNAYGERAWEKDGQYAGVQRSDELGTNANVNKQTTKDLAEIAQQANVAEGIAHTTGVKTPSTAVTFSDKALETIKKETQIG